jgi:hypothetical protein
MSRASRRAQREAEARANVEPSAPEASPLAVHDETQLSEPEALPEPTPAEEAPTEGPPAEAVEAAETQPAAEPEPPQPVAPFTFTDEGRPFDALPEPSGVRCEALVNVLWRGMTAGPGTVIVVDSKDVERLERKQLVKRL